MIEVPRACSRPLLLPRRKTLVSFEWRLTGNETNIFRRGSKVPKIAIVSFDEGSMQQVREFIAGHKYCQRVVPLKFNRSELEYAQVWSDGDWNKLNNPSEASEELDKVLNRQLITGYFKIGRIPGEMPHLVRRLETATPPIQFLLKLEEVQPERFSILGLAGLESRGVDLSEIEVDHWREDCQRDIDQTGGEDDP